MTPGISMEHKRKKSLNKICFAQNAFCIFSATTVPSFTAISEPPTHNNHFFYKYS